MPSVTQIRLPAPQAPQKTAALKLKPNTPKKIKQILQHLSSPASKYFNQKILSSKYLPQIMSQIDTWYTLDAFYITQRQIAPLHLLKSIEQICFPQLAQLYLQNVHLKNIESIEFINAPCLKAIYLMGNPVKQVKALAKTCFNLLQIIQLDSQLHHSELFYLSRAKLSRKAKIVTVDSLNANKKTTKRFLSSPLQEVIFKLESRPVLVQQSLSQKLNKRLQAIVDGVGG